MRFSIFAVLLAALLATLLATGASADELVKKHSTYGVVETLDRLEQILETRGITVFARIDHSAGANGVEMDLPSTELLLFGNPRMGTPLMLENRAIAIDLPIKALAWEDNDGEVWLGYTAPADLATRHGISPEHPSIKLMIGALDALTNAATAPDARSGPTDGATEFEPGLSYIDLTPSSGPLPTGEGRIVRTRSDTWSAAGARSGDAGLDGLNTAELARMALSNPTMAKIIANTPIGATRRWWIADGTIPEDSPGLETGAYMIDMQVIDMVDPLPAPADVATAPTDATMTGGGVAIKILRSSDGAHPTLEDDITVHYAGWTTDGHMFDASYLRDATATFPLGRLIQGWQEAVVLLRIGEKARIWIPGALAYDNRADRPFAPKGMLVFDIELIGIKGGGE